MTNFQPTHRILSDRRGISHLEYAVLMAVLVGASLVAWRGLGDSLLCSLGITQSKLSGEGGEGRCGQAPAAAAAAWEAPAQPASGAMEPAPLPPDPSATPASASTPAPIQLSPEVAARLTKDRAIFDGDRRIQTKRQILAGEVVVTAGSATDEDRKAVLAQVERMPEGGLQALKDAGIKITVVRDSVVEALPSLKGVQPRGWPPGSTWDSVPGLYDPDTKQVIIATRNGKVPKTGDGHGSVNLVYHETGHAIDEAVKGHTDADFVKARDADMAALPAYLAQTGDAGPEETYAETLALYQSDPDACRKQYPNLYAYWATDPLKRGW